MEPSVTSSRFRQVLPRHTAYAVDLVGRRPIRRERWE